MNPTLEHFHLAPLLTLRMSRLAVRMILGLLLVAGSIQLAWAAQDIKQATGNLATLRARIQQLQQQLQRDRSHRAELDATLRQTERELSIATTELTKLNQQIQAQRARLNDLVQRSDQASQALRLDRQQLASLLRAAYQMGTEPTLKLFLNQQDPPTLQRMLVYYGYFNQRRLQDMNALTQRLTQLATLKRQVIAVQLKLDQLQSEQTRAIEEIGKTRQQRQQALATLDAQMSTQQRQLATLQQNERQLQALIVQLQRELERQRQRELARQRELERQRQQALARQRALQRQQELERRQQRHPAPERRQPQAPPPPPLPLDTTSRFASLRGRLPWPTQGQLAARYGSSRYEGKMRWNGILISANQGSPVRAVAAGTVIFADALPGYGRVLIISHGNGYLTLYGQMDALAKHKDDTVSAGENLGQTGGGSAGETGLYFEIRRGTQTLNPADWLAPRA